MFIICSLILTLHINGKAEETLMQVEGRTKAETATTYIVDFSEALSHVDTLNVTPDTYSSKEVNKIDCRKE